MLAAFRVCCATAVLAVQLAASPAAHAANGVPGAFRDEFDRQDGIYSSKGSDVPEGYVIDRSLLSYTYILSSGFKHALGKLGATDRWLDIGAGQGRAVLDYCTSKYDALFQGEGPKAQAIAMSIEDRRTVDWYQTTAKLEPEQIKYLSGKPLGDYSAQELGQFQVITDVLGGFSYAPDLSRFLEKTLGVLGVNGSFYTVLQDVHSEGQTNRPYYPGASFLTEIVKPDLSNMTVCSWLKSISCVEVSCELKADFTPPVEVYRIRKTCDNVRVPTLLPIHFEAGTPPERRFRLVSPPAMLEQASATH